MARKSHFIAGLFGFVVLWLVASPAYADSYSDALKAIADTADRICGTVSTAGEAQSTKVTGEVRAQLSGLAKRLADLGVAGSGSIDSDNYVGLLRSDLLTALSSMQNCKLTVFQTLERKLVTSVNQTRSGDPIPSGTASQPDSLSGLTEKLLGRWVYEERKYVDDDGKPLTLHYNFNRNYLFFSKNSEGKIICKVFGFSYNGEGITRYMVEQFGAEPEITGGERQLRINIPKGEMRFVTGSGFGQEREGEWKHWTPDQFDLTFDGASLRGWINDDPATFNRDRGRPDFSPDDKDDMHLPDLKNLPPEFKL